MFNIEFINTPDSEVRTNPKTGPMRLRQADICCGKITINSLVEQFESPLQFWSKDNYEKQWRNAISALLAGAEKTSLITAMYDPLTANFLTWWPLYRVGQTVFLQNQLLFLKHLDKPFTVDAIEQFVRPRCTVNEDGVSISEWSIPLDEVALFQQRLRQV